MAQLSGKSIRRQDESFRLSAEIKAMEQEMEQMTRPLRAKIAAKAVEVSAIEDNVPESQEDAWYAREMEHRREQQTGSKY